MLFLYSEDTHGHARVQELKQRLIKDKRTHALSSNDRGKKICQTVQAIMPDYLQKNKN